ncbi:MAG: phosphate/phosphite/phosphonate ABC transporter substrate-binding protein [Gammaproteobacteria bacterium]
MSFFFTVSPDFSPDHLSGWYIFNTWLQKQTGVPIHLEIYNDFNEQRQAIRQDKLSLIYANPYDAAMLVREKGFLPLVKPVGVSDEAIIAVGAAHPADDVAELQQGIKLAFTDDPDVKMMGMIMLEPGDLDAHNTQSLPCDTYVQVAKHLLRGDADVGIFLAEAFDDLSEMTKKQLKVLVRSQISVIHHSLLIGPGLLDKREYFQQFLIAMTADEKSRDVLKSLGFDAWEKVDDEEMEFMIDLMDTLTV